MRTRFCYPLAAAAVLGLPLVGCGQEQGGDKGDNEARLVVQIGHSNSVDAVAFSPDGQFVLTGSQDMTGRLWDVATGKELLTLRGHTSAVRSIVFSPDGQRVLTGSFDKTARLWDARTGRELLALKGQMGLVQSVAFSPDGKRILTGSQDSLARLWDAHTGKELLTFKGHTNYVQSVAFSPDGQRVLTGSSDQTARLWDAGTGKVLLELKGHTGGVWSVAFSPDGRRVLTGDSYGQTVRLWDAHTGKEQLSFKGSPTTLHAAAFSPDGKRVLTGGRDQTARLWDAQTGKEVLALKAEGPRIDHKPNWVLAAAFSPDGKQVLTGSFGGTAQLWDARTGKELLTLGGAGQMVRSAAFSPDGKCILIAGDQTTQLWDARAGKELLALKGHTKEASSGTFSPDGRRVLTGGDDQTARLWDAQTGKELLVLKGHTKEVRAVAFAPDGKSVMTAGRDETARSWDAQTGKELLVLKFRTAPPGIGDRVDTKFAHLVRFAPDGQRVLTCGIDEVRLWDVRAGAKPAVLKDQGSEVLSAAFSPDGQRVLTGSHDGTARLWDARAGKDVLTLKGNNYPVGSVAFVPDGKRVVTLGWDNTARLWDARTGKELRAFKDFEGFIPPEAFAPDGKHVLAVTGKTVQVWDVPAGKPLCQFVSFGDDRWAVVDPVGRYDASNGGDVEGLHWVVGLEPIALKQLKERYYDPGLLAKYLGFSKEPLRDVAAFKDVKLYPEIAVTQADPKAPRLDVTLTNRGGGIGRVVVLVNGKELTADARPRGADASAAKIDVRLDLANDPRVMPGGKNTVEVLAYNAEGYLCSRGMVREFDGPGKPAAAPPHLYAVVVGVSMYSGDKLNLRYAAKDADDFAATLHRAAARLFGADQVHLTLLTAASDETRPSRAALVKALEALKGTKSGDVVVVYLAGHGVTRGGQDGDWHYLTADATSADLADLAVRKQVSLSSAELTDLLKAAPAQKQVLILDTCHSGRFIDKITEKRDVPGSQVRALERVKDRTGMHVLAGCAADSVSYEATRYGQGLLTHSLLMAMRGAKLREGEYVDVAELFGYAADKVPELARDVGGVQRPLIASPKGASFDIGRLTAEDRAKVPLQTVKPVVVRSSFQLEKPARDSLGLSRRVNDRLREASAGAGGSKLVFVDADEFPGGVQASGRYKIDGDKVTVAVSLFAADKELQAFTVEGAAGKPDELAEKIAAEVERRLATPGGK